MAVMFDSGKFPLWFDDIIAFDISTTDFDPIATEADHDIGQYTRNGFGVKNGTETAAFIRAVTLAQFRANHNSTTLPVGEEPRTIYLNGGDWCLTPVVKVYAADDATYPSTGMTDINIGLII